MANGTTDYSLGHLKADVENLKSDVSQIKSEVKALNVWKWKTVGAVGAISSVISFSVSFLT